ncbi:sucrase ferredoxin [Kribbella endophytica]
MTQPPGDPIAPAPPPSPTAPPRSDSNFVPPPRYRPETGCAASADHRGDPLFATAPPAERWLLIELNAPWPRNALTALRRSPSNTRTPQANLPRTAPDASPLQADLGSSTTDLRTPEADPRRTAPDAGPPQADLGIPTADGRTPQHELRRTDPASRTTPQAAPTNSPDTLPTEIAQLCAQLRCRPVLIRRHGRSPAGTPRRWFLVDSRPGHESIRTGELPTDEHLLAVLSGADPGTLTTDPIYLVCTHGRHDACCAVRGRPAAAALTAAYPDRTWECSHIGGDRFAANLVFLPHSLFYGHVPADQAVAIAQSYNEGTITPTYYRGSGAHPPPVQAAQHFARTTGQSLAVNALHPTSITQPAPNHWSVTLSTSDNDGPTPDPTPAHRPADPESGTAAGSPAGNSARAGPTAGESASPDVPSPSPSITVEVRADLITVDGQMTCAAQPPGQVRQFTLTAPISTPPDGP